MAPALAYVFINGQEYYNAQQKRLNENIEYFIQCIKHLSSVKYLKNLPFFVLPENLDDQFFTAHNIIISSFSYPDPTGKKINRIVLNALHTKDDLDRIAQVLDNTLATQ